MTDFLSSLLQLIQPAAQAVSGTQQQVPATQAPAMSGQPAQPTPAPAAAPQSGGIGSFLSSPLTQGALASYLGTIGAPRRGGWGGALSQGGLAGLNQYNTAQTAQQNAALQPGKLALQTAQAGQAGANTALTQAQTGQIAGIAEHNKQEASVIRQAAAGMTPDMANRANIVASDIENDTTKARNADKELVAIYSQPLKDKLTTAQTARNTAETGMIPTREDALKASAEASRASAAHSTAETGEIGKAKPVVPAKPADAALKATRTATVRDKLGKEFDSNIGMVRKAWMSPEEYQKEKEGYISSKMVALGITDTGDSILPEPPAGTPHGTVMIGPDGKPKMWVP